jgi:hypothetical protein
MLIAHSSILKHIFSLCEILKQSGYLVFGEEMLGETQRDSQKSVHLETGVENHREILALKLQKHI